MSSLYFSGQISVFTGKDVHNIRQLKLPYYAVDFQQFFVPYSDKPFDFQLDCGSEIKHKLFHTINRLPNGRMVYMQFPEHGLHSTMVVELARFILHIHATRGVEFIILTQNLDLIKALYYIQNNYDIPRVNFWLKDDENDPTFYQQDGIDKIFGSHNKALDLIEKYGKEATK